MKSLWINLIFVAALVVAVNYTSLAQTPEQLYQKGLMKEEGEGALQDAIDSYSQIADNSNADISLRAKALLHLGMCYEKLGNQEAIKAYQRLVSNFSTQKNEVAIARERLNRLILTDKLVQQSLKKDLLIRKALANTDIEPLGSISPDGRYISFVDWSSGGNVGILDLETKARQCLTDFKDPNEQAYYSSWSPDGKQIAYFWWRYDKDQYNLSVVDVKKAESRDLFISDKNGWIELGNWSSDGKYIFATLSLSDEPKSQIVRISTDDGTIKVLKTCEENYTGGKPYVSPDNRFIAYDLPDKNASGNSDIFLLSLENGQESALIKHPAHDYILGWTPDGKNIMFASDRSGTVDAMLIAVREGKPAGQPRPVTQNIGPIVPMGFTHDGSFYYGQWPGAGNIFSAEINIDEGKLLSKPTLLIQRFEGRNNSPDYSYDGKYLAYISGHGVLKKGEPGGVLCIRNLETGEENEIIPDPEISGRISNPHWSPDDQSIALACENKDGYARIYKYDIQTRKFTSLVTRSNDDLPDTEYAYPLWSHDGKSIYYLQLSPSSQISYIKVRNISTGVDKELFRYSSDDFMDRLFNISLSPDGKWLAAINRGKNRVVRLISTDDGKTRVIHTFESSGGYPYSQVWSKDGKYIIFPYLKHLSQEAREWTLMRIPFEGGESLLIEMNIHGVGSPSFHPDGRTLSFSSAGYSLPEINIWEMKNFLPSEYDVQDRATGKAGASEEIAITQVWTGPEVGDFHSISADGKYLSFVTRETGDLAIRNLETKENKLLTNEGCWNGPYYWSDDNLLTADGKKIVYSWYNNDDEYDLRSLEVNKSQPRIIYKPKTPEKIIPKLFYSDGKKVIVQRFMSNKPWYLASVNLENGDIVNLKDFEGNYSMKLAMSPDPKYFGFDFRNKNDLLRFDIHLLSTDGKEELPLVDHPANDRLIGWLPGKDVMLFTSDRSGTSDLWALNTSKLTEPGKPRLILKNVGDISPLGFNNTENLFYSVEFRKYNSYIVPMDQDEGKLQFQSRQPLFGSMRDPVWFADGVRLLYTEYSIVMGGLQAHTLILNNTETGNSRRLADNIACLTARLSPAEKSVLVFGYDGSRLTDENYKGGIYKIDIGSGTTTEISVGHDASYPVEWDNNGENIFYISNNQIIRHNIRSGKENVIFEDEDLTVMTILKRSADGNHLFFDLQKGDKEKHLMSVSLDGGGLRTISKLNVPFTHVLYKMLAFSTEGDWIYFSTGSVIWKIPNQGGNPEDIWHSENPIAGFSIHPDGTKMVLSLYEREVEIRKIENLAKEVDKIFSQNE